MFSNLIERIRANFNNTQAPYFLLGIYGCIDIISSFPVWYWVTGSIHIKNIILRLGIFILCLLLLTYKYWPQKLKPYLPFYWYFTLLYYIPFCGTYFFLSHPNSPASSVNGMLFLFLFILLADWLTFIILLPIGIILGTIAFKAFSGPIHIEHGLIENILFTYGWTIFVGILFSRNASKSRLNFQLQKQLTAVRTVCASIAHELRTPLLSIKGGANGIKMFIPRLLQGYEAAAKAKLDIPKIFPRQVEQIKQVIENIESEVDFSNTVIDTLLLNATQIAVNPQVYTANSMANCVKAALLRYPFNPSEQLEIVHFKDEHNFMYHGDDLLLTHVIFNLLKNAIYAIAAVQKGEIYIWLTNGPKFNYMHFKDTAKGLTKEEQAKLFEPFHSNTPVGTGIGLSFCRMVMQNLGGEIEVHTKPGEFAEFVLKFPKVEGKEPAMIKNPH